MKAAPNRSSTGTGTQTRPRPSASHRSPVRPLGGPPVPRLPNAPRAPLAPRPAASLGGGQWVRNERGEWVRRSEIEQIPVPDTGEPKIVQQVRNQFARWAAVTGGCFLLNLATGILDFPWFLFPAAGMGFPLLKSYAQLWQTGYSWRDVLNRPPAPDAIEAGTGKGGKGRRQIAAPRPAEFGTYYDKVKQVHTDRAAILAMMEKLPKADRELLPEVTETTEALYTRAIDLARTLNDLDQSFESEAPERIKRRMEDMKALPPGEERDRQLTLLEQQHRTAGQLMERRQAIADRLESSVLAMQNVRFDLIRIRTAGVGGVVNDLTQATQAARALSRDVDHLIEAASEVREAMG